MGGNLRGIQGNQIGPNTGCRTLWERKDLHCVKNRRLANSFWEKINALRLSGRRGVWGITQGEDKFSGRSLQSSLVVARSAETAIKEDSLSGEKKGRRGENGVRGRR